jgi:hypothetical protein
MNDTTTTPSGFIKASEPYHMRIKDVLNLPIGKKIRLFFLDRNMFDMSCDSENNPVGIPIKPSQFFRAGYFIDFTRRKELRGTWKWTYAGGDSEEDSEFHIDLGKSWYPLRNDRIPEKDSQSVFQIPDSFAGKHYSNLDPNTKIGWRGEMMYARDMDKCPNIIYTFAT